MTKFNPPNIYNIKTKPSYNWPPKLPEEKFEQSYIAKGIGVDSGVIAILDRKRRHIESFQKSFKVPNGTYQVSWSIVGNFGPVKGTGILEISTGEMMVSDPCYFDDSAGTAWDRLLNDTDYFKHPPKGWVILDKHGGDGTFTVYITLRRL